jgi:hypothetical protein
MIAQWNGCNRELVTYLKTNQEIFMDFSETHGGTAVRNIGNCVQYTWSNIPKDLNLQQYSCDNLTSL